MSGIIAYIDIKNYENDNCTQVDIGYTVKAKNNKYNIKLENSDGKNIGEEIILSGGSKNTQAIRIMAEPKEGVTLNETEIIKVTIEVAKPYVDTKEIELKIIKPYYQNEQTKIYYTTLSEAFSSSDEGTQINVIRNATETTTVINKNKNISLNLNGKTITLNNSSKINNIGTLTILGEGKIIGNANNHTIDNEGIIKVNMNDNGLIENPVLNQTHSGYRVVNNSGTLEITGGTLKGQTYNTGTLNISGTAKLTSEAYVVNSTGNINMSGGTIESTGTDGEIKNIGIHLHLSGEAKITGGTISGMTGIYNYGKVILGEDDGSVNVSSPYIYGSYRGVATNGGTIEFYDGRVGGVTYTIDESGVIITPTGYVQTKSYNSETKLYETILSKEAYYQNAESREFYLTLNDAFTCSDIGEQVNVIKDVTEITTVINKKENVILNLNGKTITLSNSSKINNIGTLTILGEGKIIGNANNHTIDNEGTIKVNMNDNGLIESPVLNQTHSGYRVVNNSGTLEITGGTLKGQTYNKGTLNISGTAKLTSETFVVNGEGNINMSGGTIESTGEVNANQNIGIHLKAPGKAEITGGTISGMTGIYNYGRVILGKNDTSVNVSSPYIYGSYKGVATSGGTIEFYDGRVGGVAYTINESGVIITPTGYETITAYNGTNYETTLMKTPNIVSEIATGFENQTITLSGSVDVPSTRSQNLNLSTSKKYMVEFDYYCKSGVNRFDVDLYPDTLPQIRPYATTTTQHYKWVLNSSDANMTSCVLRFFDDLKETDESDIIITNVKLYEVTV